MGFIQQCLQCKRSLFDQFKGCNIQRVTLGDEQNLKKRGGSNLFSHYAERLQQLKYQYMQAKKYDWVIYETLFTQTNQHSTITHTRENSRVSHNFKNILLFLTICHVQGELRITRDFLTYYSCFFYSLMLKITFQCLSSGPILEKYNKQI